jgi:hypothetical protein
MYQYLVVKVVDDDVVRTAYRNARNDFSLTFSSSQREYTPFDNELNVNCMVYQTMSDGEADTLITKLMTKFPGSSWAKAQVNAVYYQEPGPLRKAVFTELGLMPE